MIETEVHQRLRAYLKEQGHSQWPHHLTMARLVARALRIGRSALVQTDSLSAYQGRHRLSYLIPALLWPEPAILALPESLIQTVLHQDIPNLQQGLPVIKPVMAGERWPDPNFRGLLITSVQSWLGDRLSDEGNSERFPPHIPTLIDGASDLESWIRSQLSVTIASFDWETLMLAYPSQRLLLQDIRVRLTHRIFQHPANPYACHLIEAAEEALLHELFTLLDNQDSGRCLPPCWRAFRQQFYLPERLAWSQVNQEMGSVLLCCGPTDIHCQLAPLWTQQPLVLMGAALDLDSKAHHYRDRMGLGEMTCLSFGPDRQQDLIQLYLPDRLPMPNTSHYQTAVLQEIRRLLWARGLADSPTVLVIGDTPLKAQIAAALAAEFGSRVKVEAPVESSGILVTSWDYWQTHQAQIATPGLLIITTLPIPSLENPLVAGRVAAYKRRRQDWFRAYLLPETVSRLQRAIAPIRTHQGVVALLDNRVNHRSYGRQILTALSPAARSSYLDSSWFNPDTPPDFPINEGLG